MSRVFYPQARAILQVIFDGFGDDARNSPATIIPIIPQRVTVHRNSYKQADSFEMTFDANDLPIDPQLIRAGSAEIYLFQTDGITADQRVLARNLTLQDAPAFKPRDPVDAIALEVGARAARDRFTVANRPTIAGLFDDADIELSDGGKWVTISGQDYTAHLASKQWPPTERGTARRIPTGQRLDVLLEMILGEADPDGRLTLDVRNVQRAALPIVGSAEVRSNKRGIPVEQETSYWDVMYKLASRHGMILFVDGLDVVLSRPQNLSAGDEHRVRLMAWGRNIESLRLTRHLGKEKAPTVVVVGYDDRGRNRFTCEYPANGLSRVQASRNADKLTTKIKAQTRRKKKGNATPSISQQEEFVMVPAYGVTDRQVLSDMAESLYNLLGRSERTVVLKTRDLKDLREEDLMGIRSGDAVAIEWDEFNREFLADPRVPHGAKVEHLVGRGYNQAVAHTIATHYGKLDALRRPLRVREATLDYDADDGVSIEAEMVDFVLVDGPRPPQPKPSRSDLRSRKIVDGEGVPVGSPSVEARRP